MSVLLSGSLAPAGPFRHAYSAAGVLGHCQSTRGDVLVSNRDRTVRGQPNPTPSCAVQVPRRSVLACRASFKRDADSPASPGSISPGTEGAMIAAAILAQSSPGTSSSSTTTNNNSSGSVSSSLASWEDWESPLASGEWSEQRQLLLEGLPIVDAEGLARAVSILRSLPDQGGLPAGFALTERLQALLALLEQRPTDSSSGVGASAVLDAAASTVQQGSGRGVLAEQLAASFWKDDDEWRDVRAALMGVGVDASLDDSDSEWEMLGSMDVGPAGEGAVRPRVLRRLPRLDGVSAATLSGFLAELRVRQRAGSVGVVGGSEEDAWWSKASAAYEDLRDAALASTDGDL